MEGARLGVVGCGRMTGCGRVWTGVRMEDGGERDWAGRWMEGGGVRDRVWSGVEDGVEDGVEEGVRQRGKRDWVWSGVDGVVNGRRRGARLGVERCGWKMEGIERGCGGVWTGERGVVVGGQRPCTKHVSGLVSNMLRCGLKYSGIWGKMGCRWR